MNEDAPGSPESISASSPEEDETLQVSRPQCRRSLVVDDDEEDISDSSSDNDSKLVNQQPQTGDSVLIGHGSIDRSLEQSMDSEDLATDSADTAEVQNEGVSADLCDVPTARAGPFSSLLSSGETPEAVNEMTDSVSVGQDETPVEAALIIKAEPVVMKAAVIAATVVPNTSLVPPKVIAVSAAVTRKAPLVSVKAAAIPLRAAPVVSVRARSGSTDLTLNKASSSSASSSSVSSSSTVRSVIRSVGSSSAVEEKESAERWRDRLWPSRALTSFCRSITRCNPPILKAGRDIFGGHHNKDGEKNVKLVPHWNKTDLKQVINTYDTLAAHNAAFFLLLVEESRESSVQDSSEFEISRKPASDSANGWASAEVLQVVSEMKVPVSTTSSLMQSQQPYRSQSDPRLGSVWVIRIALTQFISNPYAVTDRKEDKYKGHDVSMAEFFQGGDLLLIQCHGLERPLLGIVQIWDPDFESKFGGSLTSTYNSKAGSGNKGHLVDAGGRDTVNVLLCIDSGCGVKDGESNLGGWAPQGLIVPGLIITGVCALGNVLTSIRECQALMSLRSLSKSLQEVVLCGGVKGMQYSAAHLRNGKPGIPLTKKGGVPSGGLGVKIPSMSGNFEAGPEFDPMDALLKCPDTLPLALWKALSTQYNTSQLRAIHAVCLTTPGSLASTAATDGTINKVPTAPASSSNATVTLLQGPPGTGKTRTILAIVAALLAGGGSAQRRTGSKVIAGASLRNPLAATSSSTNFNASVATKKIRILVCAPSNTAVDELAFRLHTQGVLGSNGHRQGDLSVVRIGIVGGRKDKEKEAVTGRGNQKGINLETTHMMSVVEKLSLDHLVDEKRRGMYNDHAGFDGQRSPNIMDIRKQILEKSDVVCCTLSGAGSQPILEVVMRIPGFKFDAVIIDEAAQAVEPSTLIPFKFNPHRVVMVGDPCQLPATVFSRVAKDANYGQSLFQRLHLAGYPVMMLETQYRMHRDIAEYPSARFYEGKLLTDPGVCESGSHNKPYHTDPSGKFGPMMLHNVAYGTQSTDGTSICNRDEALYVVKLYESLYEQYPSHREGVGIIAPYKAQRRLLKNMFRDRFGPSMGNVEISTIDGFQGREKDIVIFSCVRAPASGRGYQSPGIGFLKEWQRLNVAITRAKFAVWIVGHADTLGADSEWKHLIDFTKEKNYLLDVPIPEKWSKGNGNGKNKHDTASQEKRKKARFEYFQKRKEKQRIENEENGNIGGAGCEGSGAGNVNTDAVDMDIEVDVSIVKSEPVYAVHRGMDKQALATNSQPHLSSSSTHTNTSTSASASTSRSDATSRSGTDVNNNSNSNNNNDSNSNENQTNSMNNHDDNSMRSGDTITRTEHDNVSAVSGRISSNTELLSNPQCSSSSEVFVKPSLSSVSVPVPISHSLPPPPPPTPPPSSTAASAPAPAPPPPPPPNPTTGPFTTGTAPSFTTTPSSTISPRPPPPSVPRPPVVPTPSVSSAPFSAPALAPPAPSTSSSISSSSSSSLAECDMVHVKREREDHVVRKQITGTQDSSQNHTVDGPPAPPASTASAISEENTSKRNRTEVPVPALGPFSSERSVPNPTQPLPPSGAIVVAGDRGGGVDSTTAQE